MKKEEIDKLIEESLSKEDAEFYHQFDEQSMFKQWGGLYSSKLGGWAVLITTVQLVFTVLVFYFGYKLFTTEGTDSLIIWAALFFICYVAVSMLKLWHWMQMDKNTILQEMKRIEFQIAVLTEKIAEKK